MNTSKKKQGDFDFKTMLDSVSKQFGMNSKATSKSKSTLIPHNVQNVVNTGLPPAAGSHNPSKRSPRLEDPEEESNRPHNNKEAFNMMKDTHMMERYSQYLNKCMFMTSDPFIKRKY